MRTILFLVLSTLSFNLLAQSDCVEGRYTSQIFSTFTKTTVQYGKNIGINTSDSLRLMMDVYTPDGDTASARPVIIWAHGGSFIAGNRSEMQILCEDYAKMGYVTASIDYHLWPILSGFPDSTQVIDVVVKAIGDAKAAVRYFKEDQASSNNFQIDSTRIILGGVSAGGILVMHAAHMDESDNIPSWVQTVIDANGGIEGEANFLPHTSDILAVINLSGALLDVDFIDSEDPPFVSYHGTDDSVVPFERGVANGILVLEGSGLCHQQGDLVNVTNQIDSVVGGGHSNIYDINGPFSSNWAVFSNRLGLFVGNQVCPQLISLNESFVESSEISLYPNPSHDVIDVRLPSNSYNLTIRLFDVMGRTVLQRENVWDYESIRIQHPGTNGMYFLEISARESGLRPVVKKVVFN